jgi:hypothetical protein
MLLSVQHLLLMARDEIRDIQREMLTSLPPDELNIYMRFYHDEVGELDSYDSLIQSIKVQLRSMPLPVHYILLRASQDIACTPSRWPSLDSHLTDQVKAYENKSHHGIAYLLHLARVRMRATRLTWADTGGLRRSRKTFLKGWGAVFVAHELDKNDAYLNLKRYWGIDILNGQFFTPRGALEIPAIMEDIRKDGRVDILNRTVSLMEHDAGIRQPWPTGQLGEADITGRTSAYVACMRNDSALLDQVIAKDPLMLTSVHGWLEISPLGIAVCRDFLHSLVKMKQHDHEDFRKAIFEKNGFGRIAIHWAADLGRANIIRYLLDHLPHLHLDLVYAEDESGRIPLHLAAAGSHMEVVDLLLKVDPSQRNAVNEDGETPSEWAAAMGHTQIAKLLEPDAESTSSSGDTTDEGGDDDTDNGLTLMDFETN